MTGYWLALQSIGITNNHRHWTQYQYVICISTKYWNKRWETWFRNYIILHEPNKSLGVFGPSARRDSSVLYFVTFERKAECFGSSSFQNSLISSIVPLFPPNSAGKISSPTSWRKISMFDLKTLKKILPFWVFPGCPDLAEASLFSCICHPALTWTCWQTAPAGRACWWWRVRNYRSEAGSP